MSFNAMNTMNRMTISNVKTWKWSALDAGTNNSVFAIAIDGSGNIYAGGSFTSAGVITVNRIAKYTVSTNTWSALGTSPNVGTNNTVGAISIDGSGNLYVCGIFSTAGGVSANRIAKYTPGATPNPWSAIGSTLTGSVNAIAIDGSGNIYAGGLFTSAGGVTVNRIAKYTPGATPNPWSALGSGTNDIVRHVVIDGSGNIYAGGQFITADGVTVNRIAKYSQQ
jgi:isoaspartyl peptidase/L-asparaginase-like protein (Ntn-hydrolase superfamily)